MTPAAAALVFIGGCAGGACRLAIDHAIETQDWAYDIVAINVAGSALLGAVTGWWSVRGQRWWTPLVGPGLLGGFTTYSAMAAPHPDAPWQAAVSLVATLVLCAVAAAGAWSLARRIVHSPAADEAAGEAPHEAAAQAHP